MATAENGVRSQLAFRTLNYRDSLGVFASGLLSLDLFEVLLDAGQIHSGLRGTPEGLAVRQTFRQEQTFFGFELGRYFIDGRQYYGRLGLKFVGFFPASIWAWRAGLQTGTRATPSSPWDVEFALNTCIYFNHLSDFIFANLGTGRTYYWGQKEQSLRLGAWVSFATKNARVPTAENLLFTIGPSARYTHPSWGAFTLSVPLRIWVDRQQDTLAYLSEFDVPALRLSWNLQF